ncbi:ion channel [Natranaerovirga hydrolytica]|uniref:Ion channel n=1 Tax=Natranaerovirga hydrolytica TaxID=680378 RepID=A0A4R1MWZ9_9FIRM|nr:ion channel [Natranaerovirga hydrolytica]TCK97767.1 ion channel [Natranaerovirga hydrolytica]
MYKSQNSYFKIAFILFIFSVLFSLMLKAQFFYYISFLFFSMVLLSINKMSYYTSFLFNSILLITLPTLLFYYHYLLLNHSTTHTTIYIICLFFFLSILNFIILAYNIKPALEFKRRTFLYQYETLIRIVLLFIFYIILLYSVLSTFSVLYHYLSKLFNEGLEGSNAYTSKLDALYFSSTTFFTIGFGDITPLDYSETTKKLVMIQALFGHLITTVLWPIAIIIIFSNKHQLQELLLSKHSKQRTRLPRTKS